jgi:hypothetical protein
MDMGVCLLLQLCKWSVIRYLRLRDACAFVHAHNDACGVRCVARCYKGGITAHAHTSHDGVCCPSTIHDVFFFGTGNMHARTTHVHTHTHAHTHTHIHTHTHTHTHKHTHTHRARMCRFFIPSRFLPKKHDYFQLNEIKIQHSDKTCACCLEVCSDRESLVFSLTHTHTHTRTHTCIKR